jgi:hypothetical protein
MGARGRRGGQVSPVFICDKVQALNFFASRFNNGWLHWVHSWGFRRRYQLGRRMGVPVEEGNGKEYREMLMSSANPSSKRFFSGKFIFPSSFESVLWLNER